MSLEVLSLGSRRTLAGVTLQPASTANVTVIAPMGKAFELVGGVRNLFNVQYADSASDAHQQDVIPQNGRTARVGLRWKHGATYVRLGLRGVQSGTGVFAMRSG